MALALSVGGWVLTAPNAGAIAAPFARAAKAPTKAPTKADAQRFVGQLERAFRSADAAFLLGHLDPAVITRYGMDACRTYTATLNDPTRRLHVKKVTGPSDFTYASDGLSTTVHKVFTVAIDQVAYGKKKAVNVHVTANTWFSDCGTALPPSSAGSSSGVLALIAGHFTGPWRNLTFGSTGTVDVTIKLDKKHGRLSVVTKLTGQVFGAPAPKPESFKSKLDLSNLTKPVTVTSKTFGAVTSALQPDGSIVVNALDVPGTRVNTFKLVGKLTPSGFTATYTVGLADGTQASGTITLTKAP
jgi:hypothetical protein